MCLAVLYDIVLLSNISLSCRSRCGCECVCVCRAGEHRACWRVWMDQVGMGNAEHKEALTKGEVLPRPASSQSEVRILPSEPAPSWEQPMRFHCSFPTELFLENPVVIYSSLCYFITEFIYEHKHLLWSSGYDLRASKWWQDRCIVFLCKELHHINEQSLCCERMQM